jgi:hypothetical protein
MLCVMLRSAIALLLVTSASACSGSSSPGATAERAKPTAPATTAASAQIGPAKRDTDVVLSKVCRAFDATVAEGKGDQQLLARAAMKATEQGVSEAQLAELGALPPALLASIRARGNPPECVALVGYLEAAR